MSSGYEQLLQSALDKIHSGVIIVNQHLQITFINGWLTRLLNIDNASFIGEPLTTIIPQADKPRLINAIKAALEKGISSKLSATFEPNLLELHDPVSSHPLSHSTNISVLEQADGNVCMINIVDETKPLKRESLLAEYIKKLKDAEVELQHSRDLALQASKAKGEFIARMSHQLRTPLNAIVGFSELLSEGVLGDLNADQLDSAKQINLSGAKLSEFVAQILLLSELNECDQALVEPVSTANEVSQILQSNTALNDDGRIQISFEPVNHEQLHIQGNRQVIHALIKNMLSVACLCQDDLLEIKIEQDVKSSEKKVLLLLKGHYKRVPLHKDPDTDSVIQSNNEQINTDLDVGFMLELSQQLADQSHIEIDYLEETGIVIAFSK